MTTSLATLEEQKTALLAGLNGWSDTELRLHPANGGWSAVQVIDHLAKTEVRIQVRVRDNLLTPHRLGLRDRAGTLLLQRIFRSDRRVKVPASATDVLPDADPELTSVAAQSQQSRDALALLLEEVPLAQREFGVFRHPVAGWMNIAGVLDFFAVHMHHHGFQLKALRQTAGASPRSTPG